MELPVFNESGKDTGKKANLSDSVFNIEPSQQSIYLDVKHFLANQRQGTHSTKDRGEVSGSTKKPYKQKGTGNARQGHKRAPHMRHGGTVFGPKPRDYGFTLNKKTKQLARRSALTLKSKEQKITVIDTISSSAIKTKQIVNLLQSFQFNTAKILIVTPKHNKNIYLSCRNIPKLKVLESAQLNTYDIMNADRVVLMNEAVELVNTALG